MNEADVRNRPANQPLVIAYGGGVDSTAVIIGLRERGIRPDAITFADTGGERPGTYEWLDTFDAWLLSVGYPKILRLRRVPPRAPYRTLEEQCLHRKELPSRAFGRGGCSRDWKIRPQLAWLKDWTLAKLAWANNLKVIKAIGYEAGEERRLKGIEDEGVAHWYPLMDWGWTREACVEAIKRMGLPVPPKSSCFFCPSRTKTEILELQEENPELFARALAIEANAQEGLQVVKGLGRRFAWGTLVILNDTERAKLPEAPVESCTECNDDSETCGRES